MKIGFRPLNWAFAIAIAIAAMPVAAFGQITTSPSGKECSEPTLSTVPETGWPQGSKVNVNINPTGYSAAQLAAVAAAFANWSGVGGVTFNITYNVTLNPASPQNMNVVAGQLPTTEAGNTTRTVLLPAGTDSYAITVLNAGVTDLNTLTITMAHEIGHTFGLADNTTVTSSVMESDICGTLNNSSGCGAVGPTQTDLLAVDCEDSYTANDCSPSTPPNPNNTVCQCGAGTSGNCPGGLVCQGATCGCSNSCDDPQCAGWTSACGTCRVDGNCTCGQTCQGSVCVSPPSAGGGGNGGGDGGGGDGGNGGGTTNVVTSSGGSSHGVVAEDNVCSVGCSGLPVQCADGSQQQCSNGSWSATTIARHLSQFATTGILPRAPVMAQVGTAVQFRRVPVWAMESRARLLPIAAIRATHAHRLQAVAAPALQQGTWIAVAATVAIAMAA